MTFEEFNALEDRAVQREDFLEYLAALSPWMTYNVNRGKDADERPIYDFMYKWSDRQQATRATQDTVAAAPRQRGRPAILKAPVPATGMRYALPGERPPSKYSPGESDGVIERYDAVARAFRRGGVRR